MSSTTKIAFGLLLLGGLVASLLLRQPSFPSDITAFLPVDSRSADLAKRIATSGMSRRVVVLIESSDPAEAGEVADAMATSLIAQNTIFAAASAGPPAQSESIHELYFPYRYNFYAPTSDALERLNTDAGMRQAAANFISALQGPFAPLLHRLGPQDPLLAYVHTLERLAALNEMGLSTVEGRFRTADGGAVVFLELTDSPFGAEFAQRVQTQIGAAFDEATDNPKMTLSVSGAHRYTLAISSMIKADIQRITFVSLVGLLFVFGFVFGRLRTVALPLISIGVGTAVAFATTAAVFGSVHMLTIAFGASLIGVCVDYSVHYLNHHAGDHVWPAIHIGAATTLGGFVALFSSSVNALHQIALFACVGVLTSVVVTRILARTWFKSPEFANRHQRAVHLAHRGLTAIRERAWLGALLALPVVGSLLGLSQLTLERDMSGISHPIPELAEVDEHVTSKVGGVRSSNFVVVDADDAATALRKNDQLAVALQDAVDDDLVQHFTSMHSLVWSPQNQTMNRTFFDEHGDDLKARMATAFDAAGVHGDQLQPITEGFALPDDDLALDAVRQSDLGPVADLFDPEGSGQLLLTYLGEVSDEAALRERVEATGAYWFDQRRSLDEAWSMLGREVITAAAIGLGAILLVGLIAYRDPRTVAIALAPALLASMSTVGFLSVLGYAVGPIHGLALLLVIAIAADYGVMLEAHHRTPGPLALSILMAFATTMCSFGALSLSQHPVLHGFGVTIATGVTFSLLLLPGLDRLLARSGPTS